MAALNYNTKLQNKIVHQSIIISAQEKEVINQCITMYHHKSF